ncbi:hypothetical protein JHD50_07810 [Sulfurimonas sp. MAG313]|nr:DEAD/DEAH box helicase family protein [Sulfurimonas sp. MAG313]MDF1881208.1 hypothetical protein [Sulfurimonas sp. MAG313]
MLEKFIYDDIIHLRDNPREVKRFIFEGLEYNAYFARDKTTLLIDSHKSPNFKAQKLTTFIYSLNNRLGVENQYTPPPTAPPPKEPTYDQTPTLSKITDIKELSPAFLETMQLSDILKEDYENHPNIKMYDKTHEILYFGNEEDGYNARFKWNGKFKYDDWSTFSKESGFRSIGGYFKGANKERSTLIIGEGLKDGVNGNIVLPQCDVLATDSKSIRIVFELLKGKKYKTIILFQDRTKNVPLIPKEILYLFENLKGEDRKILNKIYFVDYNKLDENISDLTDFLQSLKMNRNMIKRYALNSIKKVLHNERVKDLENAIEIDEKINPRIEDAKSHENLPLLKKLVQKKLKLNGNIEEDIKYYIKKQVTPPQNYKLIHLNSSKYLSDATDEIVSEFKIHNKIILGSPTGTGKSTFAKGFLMDKFKNVILISPLKKVTFELSEHTENDLKAYKSKGIKTPDITHIENNRDLDFVMVDINKPYISITTDTLYNLLHNKSTKEAMEYRLSQCEVIGNDEQHIVHQSHNFRGKVVWVNDYLRDNYNGKVLSMSGTPIYSDLPNFHPILCKLDKRYFSKIDYFLDPFEDEKDLLGNIKKELKKGNVLLYSKSRERAKYIQRYLIENSLNTLLVTSKENVKNIENEEIEIDDSGINDIKENIAIVSTTRATTGANFKNLSVIYQFGSAYDPHTFIQLMARIRGNGKFYFIKTAGDKAQDESLKNKAINILNTAKKLGLKKASELFEDVSHEEYVRERIELPYEERNVKTFLSTYKRALGMIASEGLGKESKDKDDFEFTNRLDEIEENTFDNIFENGDSAEFTKYIEREMIDFLQRKGDIEILNHAYNLSFDIVHNNKGLAYKDVKSKEFITIEDATERELLKEEKKEKIDKFKGEIGLKFDWLLNAKNKVEFFRNFTNAELSKLINDKRLDKQNTKNIINAKKSFKEKLTLLKFFLIPKSVMIEETFEVIKIKEFITINELSKVLEQKRYLTMKTSKNPFAPFIKAFLEDANIFKNGLELYPRKKIKGKSESNVITLPKQKLDELKKIQDKEMKEIARVKELDDAMLRSIEAIRQKSGYEFEITLEK